MEVVDLDQVVGEVDFLIITVLQEEFEAVEAHFPATKATQGAEMRLKSLERLRERRDVVEQHIEDRRDQVRTDAYAARAAREGGVSLELRTT